MLPLSFPLYLCRLTIVELTWKELVLWQRYGTSPQQTGGKLLLVMSFFFKVNSCQHEVSFKMVVYVYMSLHAHTEISSHWRRDCAALGPHLTCGNCLQDSNLNVASFFARYDALCDYFVEKQRVGHMLAMRVWK